MAKRWPMFAILGLFVAHLGLAATLPPADDELYYWCWSQDLQASYYDHPPMTAYLIRVSTAVFGNHLVAVRLPACLCTLGSLLLLAPLIQPRAFHVVVFLLPVYAFGAILITPDAPLLFFWTAYLVWLIRLHQCDRATWRLWAVGGVLLGLGILSKYTMGLACLTAGLSLAVSRPLKLWVGGFSLHLVVAFFVSLPLLVFNLQQDFAPLLYQWRHAMQTAQPTVKYFPEFVGVQIVLAGLLPFILVPWVVRHRRELAADPRLRVSAMMFAIPFVFFLLKATRGRLEGNWALVSYIGFFPVAAFALSTLPRPAMRWGYATFAVPVGATLLLALHLSMPFDVLPAKADRLSRLKEKYATMNRLGESLRAMPECPTVFAPSYQLTSHLRFQGVTAEQIPNISRPSHFTQTPARIADHGEALVLFEGPLPPVVTIGFNAPEWLAAFPVVVRDQPITTYHLFKLTKRAVASR